MSLADQQWCPTSVQVAVLQARGLRIKGKSGTNDAYAVMQVGKEKYQTSVVEKSVTPVWKEEAAFDLPPLLQQGGGGGGTERSTLHVHVLHRALVGPDKLLGQAVINLLQLSEDKTRNKTEWFKLLDKTGKADKDRGEVLVDIQFMRNNMTASMFDISAAGKSRSRLGKIKDKVRGKKKESDTVSTVVPSFTQVLTDSEEEGNRDGEVAAGKDEKKKKLKMKSLFSPKSNLQRNMSQSMSVLPAKNSSLSGSQSSGLNVDSSEGKKKFKFMIHKRSGSSDSKDSSSGHQKHGAAEQSNLCINGSHVYCEEPQPRTSRIGSNFSLTSSGHGSMEDVPESSPPSVDSLRAVRQYSPWTEEEEEEEEETAEVENIKEDVGELRREEEERIRIEEERMRKEEEEERVRRQEQELERLAEEKRRQEEEEEERRRTEEEKVKREEEEKIRREEEEKALEERRREEERVRRGEEEERERLAEEKTRLEEEEKKQREEEERIRMKEEMAKEERRRQEEVRKLAEEKRRLEEQERRRSEEEEKRQRQEEERIRLKEEMAKEERRQEERKLAEEKRRLEEQERKRIEEEEKRQREEEEMIRVKEEMAEEERKLAEEKRRLEEQERRRIEEEEKRQREEEERIRLKEEMAKEERRRKEEEHKLAEEKRRLEEERRRIEEEKVRKEEEERAQKERRRREEEDMVRRQEEELEEKRRLEEQERRQREEEERIKKEEEKARREKEEYERLVEEKRILEEQERRRIEEEEKRQREEEERIRIDEERRRKEEDERVRRQEEEEELERLAEEKRRQEEEERRRTEEEKVKREKEERIRKEEEERAREERRQEEEERAKREKEEIERLAEEKRRLEEQEKRSIEEEERIRREEKAEEAQKLEKEKLTADAEEEKKRENKTKHKVAGKKSEVAVEVTSTNPFDENVSNNPFEEIPSSHAGPDSSTIKVSTVQQRCQSAVSSVGSKTVSTDEKGFISSHREKRPAPQPPVRNQAESQRELNGSTPQLAQINKQSKDKEVKTVSVLPQRSVQMIAPLSRSPTDSKNTQSLMQSSTTKGTSNVAKHSKRPAPSRPRSVEEGPSSEPKTALSYDGNISHECGSEAKQEPVVYGLNPFEDEDENELTAQDDTTTSGKSGSIQWPPAVSQAPDKDGASQTKIKSSKVAHAPPLPAKKAATPSTLINQNAEGDHVTDDTGMTVHDNSVTHACDPESEAISRVRVQETPLQESQPATVQSAGEEAGGKKEGPPTTSRRLQPVKPLNPLEQQSASVVQGEKDNKSTGILCEVQKKTKVNDTGLKGPYSQLTQVELISLVLKQKNQLSEKDNKISELEQYIDNLLVRVIEEQPSILMSLNSLKKPV